MSAGHGGGGGGGGFIQTVLSYAMMIAMIAVLAIFVKRLIWAEAASISHDIAHAIDGFFGDEPEELQRREAVADNICAGSAEHPEAFVAIATKQGVPVRPEYAAALNAIASIESGTTGNYDALGKVITDRSSMYEGDRAYGRYQIMGKNVPEWSKQVLGVELTPEDFLANHEFQDIVAYAKVIDIWKQRNGNVLDVAATWQSGRTYAEAEQSGVGDGISSTVHYAKTVAGYFNENLAMCQGGVGGPGNGLAAFPTDCRSIGRNFKWSDNPFGGEGTELHMGMDIGGCPANSRNYAAMAGTVTFAGPAGSCGNMVTIDNGVRDGHRMEMQYCHHSSLLVTKGQAVRAGDPIGFTGSTGRSTGTHCHFEVKVDGQTINAAEWFRMVGIVPPTALLARN